MFVKQAFYTYISDQLISVNFTSSPCTWLKNSFLITYKIYMDKSLGLAKHMNRIIKIFLIIVGKAYPEVGCSHLQVARRFLYC